MDDQGSCPCNMGSEGLEHAEVCQKCNSYADVDERRLRPLEVRGCAVEIIANVIKPETAPERRAGYEDRTPILTDVRGFD